MNEHASVVEVRIAVRSKPALALDPSMQERPLGWCIFAAFFALYMLSTTDHMLGFTDSGSMFGAAERMLDHGVSTARDGMHDKWCLGQLLLDLFVVWLRRLAGLATSTQQQVLLRLQTVLPATLGAAVPSLVFAIGRRLGYPRVTAILAALAVGLGTMTWVYVQMLFSESTLALLWLVVIYALLAFHDTNRIRWLVLAGCAGGYALITKTASAVVLPILPLWAASSLWVRAKTSPPQARMIAGAACALLLPLLAFAALDLWYNYARFGDLLNSGYSNERDGAGGGFTTPLLAGLFGLALSPGKGFFVFNPIAVLGLLGIGLFVRRHRVAGIALLTIVAGIVLVHARWWAWHGDFCWGPRFMVPLTPLFGLFSLPVIDRALDRTTRWRNSRLLLMAALLQLSIAVQVLGLAFDPGRFIDLVSARCGIFRGGGYFNETKFPLLDDGLMLHFVPHFSPIPGHLWMLRAATAPDPATRATILADPPWRALNPRWVPRNPERLDTSLSIWWGREQREWRAKQHQPDLSLPLASALGLLLLGAVVTLLRRLLARPTTVVSVA
jgi:hypothetical protein